LYRGFSWHCIFSSPDLLLQASVASAQDPFGFLHLILRPNTPLRLGAARSVCS
jgi:hypothetical protein